VTTLFDAVGGDKLRLVVEDLYDRLFADVMIGFLFKGRDRERLVQKEWELVAELLGGPVRYSGRTMAEAHGRLPIMGGHFERRLQILRETLAHHAIPEEARRRWLEHSLAQRAQVTRDGSGVCDAAPPGGRHDGPGPSSSP
jgi:hemoglobin